MAAIFLKNRGGVLTSSGFASSEEDESTESLSQLESPPAHSKYLKPRRRQSVDDAGTRTSTDESDDSRANWRNLAEKKKSPSAKPSSHRDPLGSDANIVRPAMLRRRTSSSDHIRKSTTKEPPSPLDRNRSVSRGTTFPATKPHKLETVRRKSLTAPRTTTPDLPTVSSLGITHHLQVNYSPQPAIRSLTQEILSSQGLQVPKDLGHLRRKSAEHY